MPHLSYRDEDGQVRAIELRDGLTIGRLPDCDLVIPTKYVSRRHARVVRNGSEWVLEDLASSGGTFVNRLRATRKVLQDEDEIRIGELRIQFSARPPAGARPTVKARAVAGRTAPGALAAPVGFDEDAVTDASWAAPEILAEQPVDAGDLMRRTISAREFDLRRLQEADAATKERPRLVERGSEGSLLALVRISDGIHRCPDLGSVVRTALEMAIRATGADRGCVALRMADGATLAPAVSLVNQRGTLGEGEVRPSRTFVERSMRERLALIAKDTDRDVDLSKARSVVSMDIRSILCVPLWDGEESLGYLYLDTIGTGRRFDARDLDLLCVIGYHAAAAIGRLKLADRIREEEMHRRQLSRFFSADVVRLLESDQDLEAAREQVVTVLFSDLQGFTALSEGMPPTELRALLESYFDTMTEILVDRHGGTLDKYIGDGIMALFGAPFSRGPDEDARAAVAAAVEMRDSLARLRQAVPAYRDLHMRIGVNTGKVLAGMLGSKRRLEYSVVGDAVNVASRLESTCEPDRIQIGEATWNSVKDRFACESAGERQVKNRARAVKCWWVEGARS